MILVYLNNSIRNNVNQHQQHRALPDRDHPNIMPQINMCQQLIERLLYLVCVNDGESGGSGNMATTCQLHSCTFLT